MKVYPEHIEIKLEVEGIRQVIKSYCQSEKGASLVDEALPIDDFEQLQELHGQTKDAMAIASGGVNRPLTGFVDVAPFLSKIKTPGLFLDPSELRNLCRGLEVLYDWTQFIKKNKDEYPNLVKLTFGFIADTTIVDLINHVIDAKGEVRDQASEELAEVRSSIRRAEGKVRKSIRNILDDVKKNKYTDEDTEVTIREGRLVIPIKAEHKRHIAGFVHDESSTGQTVFMEPTQVLELNNQVRELKYQERREIQRILLAVSDQIRMHQDELRFGGEFLVRMDFIYAKALFAAAYEANIPQMTSTPGIKLINAFHPLLFQLHRDQGKPVVPLTLELTHDKHRMLVISGPNAGGKSVALKTTGLLQYLFQCGFPVTTDELSEFGIFKHIYIDIGDSQSLENDLSTYSSRLTAMKYFGKFADKKTLVLIDEFGTGTEPQFGGAIAEAMLDRLAFLKSFGVITTHYANIKKYAEHAKGMINGAMRYDTTKLEPLFHLEVGKPGSSFAFEIAKKIGLHPSMIKYAEKMIGSSHLDYDRLLTELESDKNKYEKLVRQQQKKEDELSSLRDDYEAVKKMLDHDKKRIIKEAKDEARRIVDGANQKVEKAIRDIKESQADKAKAKAVRADIDKMRTGLKKDDLKQTEVVKRKVSDEQLEVGDKVKVDDQETVGEVIAVQNKQAQVSFGLLKSFVDIKRLQKVSNRQAKKEAKKKIGGISIIDKANSFTSELDLRGKRAEEALPLVDRFIDDALLTGASELRILHGKGHGILRDIIRNHLRDESHISTMSDEHIDRGGSGITLVTLK
ncbi:MAG: endonuclease MutS2 [Cyclobacteriaceae bacterium]